MTSTDGALCQLVTLLLLLLLGEAGVEANTAGSASQHSLYKHFQNPHVQISEKLQTELLLCIDKEYHEK